MRTCALRYGCKVGAPRSHDVVPLKDCDPRRVELRVLQVRLRGRGSGYREGTQAMELDAPLRINLSAKVWVSSSHGWVVRLQEFSDYCGAVATWFGS